MTPEGITKKHVNSLLKKHNVYKYMPVSNGMGMPALDYIICFQGKFASIETKAWDSTKGMTARQLHTAVQIKKAGGEIFLVSDLDSLRKLENWLVVTSLCKGEN